MKTKVISLLFLCLILFQAAGLFSEPVYKINYTDDIIFLTVSTSAFLGSYLYEEKTRTMGHPNKDDLFAWDRQTMSSYSKSISEVSDGLVYGYLATVGFLVMDKENYLTNGFVAGEVIMTQGAVSNWIKKSVPRKRPYLYYDDVREEFKTDKDSFHSFYSLHTSNAFAASTYIYFTLKNKYPDIPLYLVYVPAFGVAALRVSSGNHFLTDVTTGAVAGTAIAWFICNKHLIKSNFSLDLTPDKLGLTYKF